MLEQLETEVCKFKRELWIDPRPELPWEWRKRSYWLSGRSLSRPVQNESVSWFKRYIREVVVNVTLSKLFDNSSKQLIEK